MPLRGGVEVKGIVRVLYSTFGYVYIDLRRLYERFPATQAMTQEELEAWLDAALHTSRFEYFVHDAANESDVQEEDFGIYDFEILTNAAEGE